MERIVYVLGAGFSANLGLPVISNFREKSQSLYLEDGEKFAHFRGVFDAIKKLSAIKNFYDVDLYNIEEILSLLAMSDFVDGGKSLQEQFTRYIQEVILACTPNIPVLQSLPGNYTDHLFGGANVNWEPNLWQPYGYFIASLCGISMSRSQNGEVSCRSEMRTSNTS